MIGAIIFLLVGITLWVAGGVVLYFRSRTLGKAGLMQEVSTSAASEVAALAPGTLVELKGTLRCDSPLVSEMAEQDCAYYSSRVVREYTEEDRHDDEVGSNRRSETLSHNERFAPFAVEDATGKVPVNAESAEVDAKQVVDRFERDAGGAGISFKGVTLRLGGGERTIGYRYTESILPVDAPVYVLGAVREDGTVGPPPPGDKDSRFLVSYRSEEELGESLGSDARWLTFTAIGLFVFGAVFAAVGVAAALGYIQF
jgi:hypothetical protein